MKKSKKHRQINSFFNSISMLPIFHRFLRFKNLALFKFNPELLQAPSANPRERPKGRKNGQKKAKPKIKKQGGALFYNLQRKEVFYFFGCF